MKFFTSETNHLATSNLSGHRWSRGFDLGHPWSVPLFGFKLFGPDSSTPIRDAALFADVSSCRVEPRPTMAVERPAPLPNIPLFALTTFNVVKQVPVRSYPVVLRKSVAFSQNFAGHYAQASKRTPCPAIGPKITSATSTGSRARISRSMYPFPTITSFETASRSSAI